MQIIDLTHPLDTGIPLWPGDPAFEVAPHASIASEGYLLHRVSIGEHSGTHVGTAAHLNPSGRDVASLPVASLVLPACVVDARGRVARWRLGIEELQRWEAENGRIAEGCAVLLCTGWSQRWADPVSYLGSMDGSRLAWPGFSLDAARFLAEERGVVALGIDTHGIDAGDDDELSVNRWWLDGDRYHLENLTRLEQLPPTGTTLVVGALPVVGGSGAPARVLGLVTQSA
jgi:kynurenine formamidase